jgi:hypothetical protein
MVESQDELPDHALPALVAKTGCNSKFARCLNA